jgi:hypothetical protein
LTSSEQDEEQRIKIKKSFEKIVEVETVINSKFETSQEIN